MLYKPSFESIVRSTMFALWPVGTAALVTYFFWNPDRKVLLLTLAGLQVLLSGFLLLQAVLVHCNKLWLDERGIRVAGPIIATQMAWAEIASALLRERVNAVSRTDRMLVLRSKSNQLIFNTSVLNPRDEEAVLQAIRARTNLVVQRDRPSI